MRLCDSAHKQIAREYAAMCHVGERPRGEGAPSAVAGFGMLLLFPIGMPCRSEQRLFPSSVVLSHKEFPL